jgi:soluble lytic murein transglycosylase-like protein
LWSTIGLSLVAVLSINTLVRVLGGGTPNPVSLVHLGDKTRALAGLAAHGSRHLFGNPHTTDRETIRAAARRNGVPESLALAVARTESSFHPHAISYTGAMGLMQLMPDTAAEFGVRDAFDSSDNADGATRYLRRLLARYRGDTARAVAAYNAGPGMVPKQGRAELPRETRHYVHTVLGTPQSGSIAGL